MSPLTDRKKLVRAARLLKPMIRPTYPPVRTPDGQYGTYLAGQRVVLVGPAETVIGSAQHDRIEGYDRIVRLNHALPVADALAADIGRRTDIWYHNFWFHHPRALAPDALMRLAAESVDWLCCSTPYIALDDDYPLDGRVDHYLPYLPPDLHFRTVEPRLFIRTCWRTRTIISTGVAAIQDLLSFDISELYITGFTFYRGKKPYHAGYGGVGRNLADLESQRVLVKRWLARDGRIRIDEGLKHSLAEE